ncbi:unnamed protein product [Darwinula stevensoni]|uniref:Casein kinase II subunit beta n=1 Tax=Darwinula stevensoni TaxID=69355 RepID=A0A7R9AJ07_9CRUS|nr:unnamed protein product [Darwinula stevensoni]CAG0906231.1 unnamed protein product [Darwinula stevensoni]
MTRRATGKSAETRRSAASKKTRSRTVVSSRVSSCGSSLSHRREPPADTESPPDDSWLAWFCGRPGNEVFLVVDLAFIQDPFNLVDLADSVPRFGEALGVITGKKPTPHRLADTSLSASAEKLYGLVHRRFTLSERGLYLIYQKWKNRTYGECRRVFCPHQPLLPTGSTDTPSALHDTPSALHLYCPRCMDVYRPSHARHRAVDGTFFPPSLPHLFFMVYPRYRPELPQEEHVPRIFGFEIHPSAVPYQQRIADRKDRRKAKRESPDRISTDGKNPKMGIPK